MSSIVGVRGCPDLKYDAEASINSSSREKCPWSSASTWVCMSMASIASRSMAGSYRTVSQLLQGIGPALCREQLNQQLVPLPGESGLVVDAEFLIHPRHEQVRKGRRQRRGTEVVHEYLGHRAEVLQDV